MLEIDALLRYLYAHSTGEPSPPQYHEAEVRESIMVYLTAYKQARKQLIALAGPGALEEIERKAKVWQTAPDAPHALD
jgi:hypothetical protein